MLRPGADFSGVTYAIGDLDGLLLASTSGTAITVDATAAGWGWIAMDLNAVLMHELGHVLGLEHATSGIMAETLQPRTCTLRRGKATAGFGPWRAHRCWSARMAFRRSVTRC